MRKIDFNIVKNAVCDLAISANTSLRSDVFSAIKKAYSQEKSARAKHVLSQIIENASVAKKERLAICQDTGIAVVFVQIGKGLIVGGEGIEKAIQQGIRLGYKKGSLRNSIIKDPLRLKKQKSNFGPCLIHYDFNNSNKLKLTVLPKGFGCENKSKLKMFLPTADLSQIKDFIIQAVRQAGSEACPPFVIGVGVGGTADYACLLAKKALLGNILKRSSKLESDLLKMVNSLNIGPMGLGGKTTALAVKIDKAPTHIAGLPVAVNISCHALRSANIVL